jgi:ABC-type glycerol-3-phosphate transport system substrate-binding protein
MNRKSTYIDQTWVRIFTAILLLLIALLAGCSGETILDAVFPTRDAQETVSTTSTAEEGTSAVATAATTEVSATEDNPTPQPTAQETQPFTIDQSELLVWIPEEFSTLSDSGASLILQQRIEDFERQNPGTVVTVRVKASSGPSGILDSLINTQQAASAALPQIILLSQADMQEAAELQLIVPIEEFIQTADIKNFYPYAHEISSQDGVLFGFPFAGDALVGITTAEIAPSEFVEWDDIRSQKAPLYFAANYPQAHLFISQYLSSGGILTDEQGHAMIAAESMQTVLEVFDQNLQNKTFLPEFSSLNTSEDVWNAFLSGETEWVINWASRGLKSDMEGLKIFQLPSLGKEPYVSATGWVWSIVNTDTGIPELGPQFIEFLSDPVFQADYCQAAGYLPVMPNSLSLYEDDGSLNQISNILIAAHPFPENDLILEIGPIFRDATLSVINQTSSIEEIITAAQQQLEALQTK